MKNKILVVPGNTDLNRGDQALVWESIKLFEDIMPNIEVYLYESGSTIEERKLQKIQTEALNYKFVTRILLHPRVKNTSKKKTINYSRATYIKWGLTAIKDLILTLFLLSKLSFLNKIGRHFLSDSQKASLDLFPKLTALVVKGGGFLHSYGKIYDAYVMYYFLFDLMLAHRHKIKTFILPNSIGPLKNKVAKYLVKRVLSKSAFISVRENVSKNFVMQNLEIEAYKYPDLGFFLESSDFNSKNYLKKEGFDFGKKNIAITLRPYRFDGFDNPDKLYSEYINEILLFIKHQVNNDYNISLVAHTLGPSAHEDDRLALKDVYSLLDDKLKESVFYFEDFDLSCKELQKIYSHFDIMIGTRFHSVIFALNAKTPSIAIAYGGNKSYGIMKDIGLPAYVVGIENVKANALNELVYKLTENKNNYLKHLQSYQDLLVKQRKDLLRDIKSKL
jgi:colanic acid/amylovoran biosynthesis protein